MKCPNCGHDAEMHWSPDHEPPLPTTACRDCLPRNLYVHQIPRNELGVQFGMCCWTQSDIEREVTRPAPDPEAAP